MFSQILNTEKRILYAKVIFKSVCFRKSWIKLILIRWDKGQKEKFDHLSNNFIKNLKRNLKSKLIM